VAIQRNNLASVMTPSYTGPGTPMSPFSPNSNSGGGYQYRPPPKFSYGRQSGSR
jgi:hypothetical protein